MTKLLLQEPSRGWKGAPLTKLNAHLADLLSSIHRIGGVTSSFVFDNNGSRLGANVDESANVWQWTFRGDASREFGSGLGQMLAAFRVRGVRLRDMQLTFPEAGLFVRDMGNAFVVVMCRPEADWSLIRMTVNVAAAAFEADGELQKSLAAVAAWPSPVEPE